MSILDGTMFWFKTNFWEAPPCRIKETKHKSRSTEDDKMQKHSKNNRNQKQHHTEKTNHHTKQKRNGR